MQKEVDALSALTTPVRPFLAVIAGSKLDTKMGCIKAIAEKADHVMLGGQLYNAYIAAKFGVKIKGVDESDVAIARTQLLVPEVERKLVPLGVVIESDALDGCGCVPVAGKCGHLPLIAKMHSWTISKCSTKCVGQDLPSGKWEQSNLPPRLPQA